MAHSCALGLTACLAFGGHLIPAQDAFAVLDTCGAFAQLPAASFIQQNATSMADVRRAAMTSFGASMGEAIEAKGVRLEWPASGALRRQLWLHTCAQFEAAFNDKSQWSHLDKWPK